jgi:hypothetical protein
VDAGYIGKARGRLKMVQFGRSADEKVMQEYWGCWCFKGLLKMNKMEGLLYDDHRFIA